MELKIDLKSELTISYYGFDSNEHNLKKFIDEVTKHSKYKLQSNFLGKSVDLIIKMSRHEKSSKKKYYPYIFVIELFFKKKIAKKYELVFREIVIHEFKLQIFKTIIATNIAYPGSLSVRGIKIYANGTKEWELESFGDTVSLCVLDNKIKTSLKTIKLKRVWNWLMSIPGFQKEMADSQLSKVLTLLHYIFLDPREIKFETLMDGFVADIIWATVALEILYLSGVDREIGKTKELVNRIGSFLRPKRKELMITDKNIKNIYDYRSRFLHGDQEIINPFHSWEGDDFSRYFDDLRENLDMAVVIIVLTLQKLCKLNWKSLDFDILYRAR